MRLGIVHSTKSSYWNSCKTIQENLIRSLEMMGPDYEITHFDFPQNQDFSLLAADILRSNLDEIFYLAHYPHPLEFIKQLKQISTGPFRIRLVIFGSFTSWLNNWHETFIYLKDSDVRIICGSQPQCALLSKFIDADIEVLPFPVETKKFFPQEKRKVHGKNKFIYTGRISFEKNIHLLIEYLFKAQDYGIFPNGFELKLVGHFDQVHRPLFKDDGLFGSYYFYLFDEVARKVGRERFLDQVKFLGFCSHDELSNYLADSDAFVSLSTFAFEDFGMSAAEALEMGLPSLLTAWGGHHGLKTIYPEQIKLVDCELKDQKVIPIYASFEQQLISILSQKISLNTGRLSIGMTANKLVGILHHPHRKKLRIKDFFTKLISSSSINCFDNPEVFKEVYETYLTD